MAYRKSLAALMIVTCAWAASVAPIVPSRFTLPDTVRSLADLNEFQIVIQPMPSDLTREGVTAEQVKSGIKRQLSDRSLTVVEREDAPMIDCRIIAVTEPKLPDAVAYSVTLLVFQPTQIKRFEGEMILPTYTVNTIGLEPRTNLKPAVEKAIEDITRQFLDRLNQATTTRAEEQNRDAE